MKHDAPPVLAVVGVLGIMSLVCMVVGGVMTYRKCAGWDAASPRDIAAISTR